MSNTFFKLGEGIHLYGSFYVDLDEGGRNLCVYYCTFKDYADYALVLSNDFREGVKAGELIQCYEPEGKLFRLATRGEVARYMSVLMKELQRGCREI